MRFVLCIGMAAAWVFAGVPAATASYDQSDWDLTMAALAENAPTVSAPVDDPSHTIAVGGGRTAFSPGSSPRFGFGATLANGPTGEMSISVGVPATTIHARVVCLAAAPLLGGGGIATIIGEIAPPPPPGDFPLMIFNVTDSGLPGAAGDTWSGGFASSFPCVPFMGGSPIEGSIMVSVPGS
jgi:hypothetical protein